METRDEIIRRIVAEHLGLDPLGSGDDARRLGPETAGKHDPALDLGADSLDVVEVAMALEEEFGCEITDEVAYAWVTLGDVIADAASWRVQP